MPVTTLDNSLLQDASVTGNGASAKGGDWARWSTGVGRRYTLGVEEELMLLDPVDHSLLPDSDAVLVHLSSRELAQHTSPETHAGVVELATGIHLTAASACAELAALRLGLAVDLRALGVATAASGMHPRTGAEQSRLSGAERYQRLGDAMGYVARREPTMALHVHVGVPDPDDAIRVLNRIRESTAVLIALAANSPFAQGRPSGFASTRTVNFGMFPRTGTPRRFGSYAEYLDALAPVIESGALADLTHLWWDVRLQPVLGTVEVRAMDAQTSVAQAAPLVALVQSLARLALEGSADGPGSAPELLEENRFVAARDGMHARLIDPARGRLVSVRALLADLLCACRPHAIALGCERELDQLPALATDGGAADSSPPVSCSSW